MGATPAKASTDSRGAELTVIVPVYNGERWLPGLFETLLAQTYGQFKVLLVDDGSTDNSSVLMERICIDDGRFRVIRRENGGLAAARNTALDQLDTPWVTFLDADDLLHPDAFRVWMKEALRLGTGSIVKGGWKEGSVPDRKFYLPVEEVDVLPLTPEEAISRFLYQSLPLTSACGAIYDSGLFSELRFRKGMYYEDLEIGPQLLAKARQIAYVSRPLYFYRQHYGSFIHTFSDHRLDALKAVDLIAEFIDANYPSLRRAAEGRRWSAQFNIYNLLSAQKTLTPHQQRVREECRRAILAGRKAELHDPHVRLKNRIAALIAPIWMAIK